MPTRRFAELPAELRSYIRLRFEQAVRLQFRTFRAYGNSREEARNIYHAIRRMIGAGRFQRAAIYMRMHGVSTLGSIMAYPNF